MKVANGEYTVLSEVYAVGVVLLELLMGQRVAPTTARTAARDAKRQGLATLAAKADASWPASRGRGPGGPHRVLPRDGGRRAARGHARGHRTPPRGGSLLEQLSVRIIPCCGSIFFSFLVLSVDDT